MPEFQHSAPRTVEVGLVRLGADDLKEGNYVTVQMRHDGKGATALKITVVAPGQ